MVPSSLSSKAAAGAALLVALSACAPPGVERQSVYKTVPRDTAKVVVIGDSLSTGFGTSPQLAWPELFKLVPVPGKRALAITNASENGSGYLATGFEGNTFRMEVQAAVTPSTDVILFFGSDNDAGTNPEELKAAVASTFDTASSLAPKAILVAIGPLTGSEAQGQILADVCHSEASAAHDKRIRFIDPIAERWLGRRADVLLGPDGEHPSAKGQWFLRDKMGQILSAAVSD
jgi:lysophospholipase L1-like esterase